MQGPGKIEILFILGFGPIVRNADSLPALRERT